MTRLVQLILARMAEGSCRIYSKLQASIVSDTTAFGVGISSDTRDFISIRVCTVTKDFVDKRFHR